MKSKLAAVALASLIPLAIPSQAASQAPLRNELAMQLPLIATRAIAWAEEQERQAARQGARLTPEQQEIARRVGVREPGKIRLVVVDRIPLPEEAALKMAAGKAGLVPASAAGITLGYAVLVRRGYENNPRLLSHEFRHVAQYEQQGGIREFLNLHLRQLAEFGYEDSPFEVDARAHEIR
jgi:hypothetical protein